MFLACAGGSSQEVEQISSNCTKNISLQNKAGNVLDETINTVSEVSSCKQIKRRGKHFPAEDETVKADSGIITTKKKITIKTAEVSGTMQLYLLPVMLIWYYHLYPEQFCFSPLVLVNCYKLV